MAEHLIDAFDGYAVAKRYCSGEGMLCYVKCELLVDVAVVGNLFQCTVGFLVARNGYYRQGWIGHCKVEMVFSN